MPAPLTAASRVERDGYQSFCWERCTFEPGIANPTLPRTKSISYFDLDAVTRVSKLFELRAGVANLGNRKPPVTVPVAIGTYNYDLNTYDLVGRRFFVAIKARL